MQLLIEGFTKPFNTSKFTYFDISIDFLEHEHTIQE